MAKGRSARGAEDGGGGGGGSAIPGVDAEVGFAKLQGEDFEYYMQTYSIILGRNSKTSAVDVDLATLGGGMNISRHHARIFYDFPRRRFALEVLGKNGCLVEGVLHVPGTPPIKLDSQDLLQIGDKQFYFLLPSRSFFGGGAPVPRQPSGVSLAAYPGRVGPFNRGILVHDEEEEDDDDDDDGEEEEDEDEVRGAVVARNGGKRIRRDLGNEWEEKLGRAGKAGPSQRPGTKAERRSRVDREADNQQLLALEEKDVISSVATLLADLCAPGEWMPMEKLHAELVEEYANVWHHSRVRKYLTAEDWPQTEAKGRPWFGLLKLLRKYPDHFVINIQLKGKITSEFVSLVPLPS
ncbi:FHA domain-containing protein FHA2-like [Musa acuminata AAA Group]|uniref:(wild Malaysian banana) hypothetical protein n=1 Tax=Musa acuminata subsp. malaccensis TaxID=214687 RepID=A0A804JFV3_MUSAM|nr:PREDICTED: FHA domain-containing protein FHA2-like [Musa acuminata subsp. malaccensis]CAG1846151.1 unnamed protein product [Musa acuminata subsp. malaccensis]